MDKGNPTIEDELLPPDYLDQDPPLPGMAPGREGVKQANAYSGRPSRIQCTPSRIKSRKVTSGDSPPRTSHVYGECLGIPRMGLRW